MKPTNPQLKRLDRIRQEQARRLQGLPKVDPVGNAFDRAVAEYRITQNQLEEYSRTLKVPEGACPEFHAFHNSVVDDLEKGLADLESRDAEMIAVYALTSVKKRKQKTKKKRGF